MSASFVSSRTSQIISRPAFVDGGAEMTAYAPDVLADIIVRVALDRKTTQAYCAETVFQFVSDPGEQGSGCRQEEVIAAEPNNGRSARFICARAASIAARWMSISVRIQIPD